MPGEARRATGLDDIYRRALTTGLAYHDSVARVAAVGLVEEIRALDHPPLAWDAQLARWFEEHVPSANGSGPTRALRAARPVLRTSRGQGGSAR